MKTHNLLNTTLLTNFILIKDRFLRENHNYKWIYIFKFIFVIAIALHLFGSSKFEKKAYDCNHNQICNTTIVSIGEWNITSFTDGEEYQVEFISSASLRSFQTSTQSTDNLSDVQFTSVKNRNVDFGVSTTDAFADPINPLSNYTG